MFVDFNILNQLGSPSINSNTFANRPAAGQTGRLFVSIDTFEIYRDNGTTWDLIGGPGTSTVTGTGAATQVAYWTAAQSIGGSNNLWWDNTNKHLGIGISTPAGLIHADGGATAARIILDADSGVAKIFSFRTDALPRWAFRVDGAETGSNAGANLSVRSYDDTGALLLTPISVIRATGESTFSSTKTYSTGNAIGIAVQHNLTIPNGVNVGLAALGGVNSNLNLTLGGSTTVAATGRQGLEGSTSINFTGAGTLTMTQGSTVRAFSALSSVYAFNGSAVGTITHLAGLRICFPDNPGSAVNITNNYALLINDQTTGTGTVTYTNRWGIYQEGASDLNYFAANTLIGTTVNAGYKLDVNGSGRFTGDGYFDSSGTGFVGVNTLTPLGKMNIVSDGAAQANLYLTRYNSVGSHLLFLSAAGTKTVPTAIQNGNELGKISFNGYNGSNFNKTTAYIVAEATQNFTTTNQGTLLAFATTPQGDTNPIKNIYFDFNGITANNTSNSTYFFATSGAVTTNYGSASALGVGLFGTFSNHDLSIYTNSTEKARITSGGNLLIGTTTDAGQKLQVNGVIYTTTGLNINTTSTDSAQLKVNGTIGVNDYNQNTYLYVTGGVAGQRVSAFVGTYSASGSVTLATFSRVGGAVSADIKYDDSLSPLGISYGTTTNHALYFYTNNTTALLIKNDQTAEFTQSIKTAAPTGGTAAAWKLGSRVAAAVALDATQYIEVDIGGTLYKLAIVT